MEDYALPREGAGAIGRERPTLGWRLLEKALADVEMEYECRSENSPNTADPTKREILDTLKRWYQYDWLAIENKPRTSIVEGISVFLSLFDDNPLAKRTLCPPRECYDPKLEEAPSRLLKNHDVSCRAKRGIS